MNRPKYRFHCRDCSVDYIGDQPLTAHDCRAYRSDIIRRMWERHTDASGKTCAPGEWDVVIFGTRYGGCYEMCEWAALVHVDGAVEWLLDQALGGDMVAAGFWETDFALAPIGRGATPDAAYADICRIFEIGREAYEKERQAAIDAREKELTGE